MTDKKIDLNDLLKNEINSISLIPGSNGMFLKFNFQNNWSHEVHFNYGDTDKVIVTKLGNLAKRIGKSGGH